MSHETGCGPSPLNRMLPLFGVGDDPAPQSGGKPPHSIGACPFMIRCKCRPKPAVICRGAYEGGFDTVYRIILPMSKADKVLARMRASPGDWRIEELETVAGRHGFDVRKTGGSHFVFLHSDSDLAVTVPFKRPIKPIHFTQFLALLDDAGAQW